MLFTNKDIIDDKNPLIRTISKEVKLPLSKKDIEIAHGLREYVVNSIDEEKAKKYDLSPAVGIAAIQVGIDKRICSIYIQYEDKEITDLILINPKIMAYSVEKVYIPNGEACLSIKEPHEGLVHRYSYIKIKYVDVKGKEKIYEAYDFEAIAIQHEIDHLNGKLFYDHIDKTNPMKVVENSYPL